MENHGLKSSVIRRMLKSRLEKWLSTIPDTTLRAHIRDNVIVSGGCIASMLLGEKINDYDIYMRTREGALAVANYYVNLFNTTTNLPAHRVSKNRKPKVIETERVNIKGESEPRILIWMQSAGVASAEEEKPYEYFETIPDVDAAADFVDPGFDPLEEDTDLFHAAEILTSPADVSDRIPPYKRKDFAPIFFSENAITLSNKMQIVIRFYGEPAQIHSNYDFAHAMCYYDLKNNHLHAPVDALESMLSKTLIYKGSLYPIASLLRIRKFVKRGWRISAGQVLKIVFQLNGVDLKDPATLREQLIGVDQAYMHQLLTYLETENPNASQIDTAYIAVLIDRIFE